MKPERKILCVLLLVSYWTIAVQAQETIPAAGGNATGVGGSDSYTIGQISYISLSGINGSLNQGVKQPYEISVVTDIKNVGEITLHYFVYPNPTRGALKLVIEGADYENQRFQLYDIEGVLIQDGKIEARETELSLEKLPTSLYFLKVIHNNKEAKMFKIVKK
jgi:hypothetical protein